MNEITTRYRYSSFAGLFFVLIIITIFWIPNVHKSILSDDFEVRNYQMQGFDWLVVFIVFGIIIIGEKNKLSTLNIKKPTLEIMGIGLGLGGFSMLYIFIHRTVINLFGYT
jgi:hypothetical protein